MKVGDQGFCFTLRHKHHASLLFLHVSTHDRFSMFNLKVQQRRAADLNHILVTYHFESTNMIYC